MPYGTKYVKGDKKPWKITKHGKIIAESSSKAKRDSSLRARRGAEHGWKPKKRRKK